MKRINLTPHGFPCPFDQCQPGHFIFNDDICFKSEYMTARNNPEAYCSSGEYFWGGVDTLEDRNALIVQPLVVEIIEDEE